MNQLSLKKAIIFSFDFEPNEEFSEFLESIGYKKFNPRNFDISFDERVINFCEKRLSHLWNETVYKGKETYLRRCGFLGAGYLRMIDTSKKWIIIYNDVDAPIIQYVYSHTNKYGYTGLYKELF